MSRDLLLKKLFLDSRHRNVGSTSSDFRLQLPRSLWFDEGCVAYVCDVATPYTWHTITEGVNDTLYLGIFATTDGIQLGLPIKLSSQVYNVISLRDELFAKIKTGLTDMGVNGTPPQAPVIEHDLATNTLSITSLGFEESSWGWRFWSDQELTTGRSSFFWHPGQPALRQLRFFRTSTRRRSGATRPRR